MNLLTMRIGAFHAGTAETLEPALRGAGEPALPSANATAGHLTGGHLTVGHAPAGEPPAKPLPPALQPRRGGIALALGGGAAKGWAHIGALRAFEEHKIPISMIAGTSIGALVGGAYLAGKLDDLEDFARSLTWASVLRYLDFSITGSGLISGMRLATYMDLHLAGRKIEDLPAPFVSVCTDIRTGHEIWLHDGPMIEALRASYALPGIFSPVAVGGRHLVDGALVNPVPVTACRAYEPDVVIAVDLNHENFGRSAVIRASHYESSAEPSDAQPVGRNGSWFSFLGGTASPAPAPVEGHGDVAPKVRNLRNPQVQPKARLGTMGVMIESFNIIQDRISRARLAGDPPDYTVRPKLASIGLADFHKADESIRLGYVETKLRIRELMDQGQFEPA